MTTKLFSELGISQDVLKAIDKLGFEQAAPIQSEAIPVLLAGRDVAGQSQTGSGKTLAFAVPAIEKVNPQLRKVQVLILCPTRELAVQVSEEFHKLALFKRGVNALPIYGGQSYERQFHGLKQGAQIVIGTPGRVMDHMRRGTLRLDSVFMVVLDEADVMLDMGFREDIEVVLQAVPPTRQTVFFSATMPRAIQDLIQKYSKDPQTVRIEQKTLTVPTVDQVYYEVDRRFKIELLTRLIDIHDYKLGIIFCNTKRMVDDLVDHLNAQGYSADRLHGDMSQAMRDRVMNKFRKSGLEFLVATDVAARGIDVDDVQVVFNYDLPYDPEDYVHRIGRTGRAGRAGRAISFVAGRELFQIQNIERYTKMKMARSRPPTADQVEEAKAGALLEKLRATLQAGEYKRQDHLIERLLEEGFSSTDIAAALLHQMQIGDAPSAVVAPREIERSRPSRGSFQNRHEPRERGPRPAARPPRSLPRLPDATRPPAPSHRPMPPRPAKPERPARETAIPAPKPTQSTEIADTAVPAPEKLQVAPPPALPAPPPLPPLIPTPPPSAAPLPAPSRPPVRTPAPPRTRPAFEQPFKPLKPRSGPFAPPPKPKASRRTPDDQTRLYLNLGEEMGVSPGDVVGTILGETGLPSSVVGAVDVRERHLFVDVAADHAQAILAKLNRAEIKGRKLKAKVA